MRSISIQDIYEAYRKLKNYYYYDNSAFHTKRQISAFEKEFYKLEKNKFKETFHRKCSDLIEVVNNRDIADSRFDKMLNGIDFYLVPKSLKEDNTEAGLTYITNVTERKNIQIEKYNVMIDAPIEIHLISTLWLMFVGIHLAKLVKGHNYAYNFTLYTSDNDDRQHLNTGLQLYLPYYKGYQDWRDNALKKAESLLDNKKNATIVSLDVQRYFYNVRLNLPAFIKGAITKNNIEIPADYVDLIHRLTDLLQRIHIAYQSKISSFLANVDEISQLQDEAPLLPIGLLSSGLLGNLYLCKFDRLVMQNLRPDYYGRYVDDILFVIGETKASDDVNEFLSMYFINDKRGILKECVDAETKDKTVRYKLADYDTLFVQKDKLIIQNFVHYESRAAIKKFRNNINKKRSEFRFLPDEDILERDFEEAAFKINYSGSVNTFHSIKDFRGDKFGASSYLAHSIFLACYDTEEAKKKNNNKNKTKQILSFFKGNVAIEYYTLWEKVATYFVICEDVDSLNLFQSNVTKAINALSCDINQSALIQIRNSLLKILEFSIAMPISMHLSFIGPSEERKKTCYELAKDIRHANMFRHPFLGIAGLNLTECLNEDNINLYDRSLPRKSLKLLKCAALYLVPHHVHFDEINQIKFLMTLIDANSNSTNSEINERLVGAIEESKKFFEDVNFKWKGLFSKYASKEKIDFVKVNAKGCQNNSAAALYVSIKDAETVNKTKADKSVAVANIKVEDDIIARMALGKLNLSKVRRKELFRIINDAVENRCDLLVLPELSVPYQWLDLMTKECRRHNLAIICGLTYVVNPQKIAYNTVVSILPVKTKYYTTSVIVPRIKNHYAPKETKMLTAYGYHYPRKPKNNQKCVYDLVHWRKSYFSFYNCFELASIEDRSLFKSKVDFIVATELNRDVNYYSEIVGSWVRDIHCYIIQVNTSNYGDSRIMRPSSKEQRDQIIVKGGRNAAMLYDTIEIEKLREYQLPGYAGQDELGSFKNTPPQLSKSDVEIRLKDKEFK